MLDSKLFVSHLDGAFPDLYERWWDGDEWIWVDHGRPEGVNVTGIPGAEMMSAKLFVVVRDGRLWERQWRSDLGRWAWEDHGRPANRPIVAGPGAAMMNEKLFVAADDGRLFERHWRPDLGRWAWEDHGRPPGTRVNTAPDAAMMNLKLFVGTDDGRLFERFWNGNAWVWVDHGRPPGTRVNTAPGAAMMNSRLFVGTDDGRLFERFWNGSEWVWLNHGTPLHDQSQHVIGAPGTDPKLTLAVIGDGFSESDLNEYRNYVTDRVLRAVRLDALAGHQAALRVIRIDLVSVESGVTERRYDDAGTLDTSDDTVESEQVRPSRLGFVSTGNWSHCWIETSGFTAGRIQKLRRRFAPDASNVLVVLNSDVRGGCNRGLVAAVTRSEPAQVIAHELGHNLFELDDEYVTGDRTFTGTSPRANTSEQPADWANLKWRDLVAEGTPLPTDANALPADWNRRTSVGAFEGAGGHFRRGLFRPVLDCRMNQTDPPWCPVCTRKITNDLARFE
jgi:hypothetical protein